MYKSAGGKEEHNNRVQNRRKDNSRRVKRDKGKL